MEALALFIYGCSPGGSSSNNWTIIFDGDIDLSAIMTFVSTMSSICKHFQFSIILKEICCFLFVVVGNLISNFQKL